MIQHSHDTARLFMDELQTQAEETWMRNELLRQRRERRRIERHEAFAELGSAVRRLVAPGRSSSAPRTTIR